MTPVTIDVAEAPTSVTVSDASAQSVVGQTVVLTASIASPAPGPTGTVQFADNGEPIGSGAVSGGQATFETSSLALGGHADHGRLRGGRQLRRRLIDGHAHADGRPGRDVDGRDQRARPRPGRADRSPTPRRSPWRRPDPGRRPAPRRSATTGTPCPAVRGSRSLRHRPPSSRARRPTDATGPQDITVAYSGDTNFTASEGSMTESVSPVSTTTTLVPSPAASTTGQSVTLTATVSPTSGTADPDGVCVVHARRDGARELRRVDDERHQLRQHAAHDPAPRLGPGHRDVQRQQPTSSPVRLPARHPSP